MPPYAEDVALGTEVRNVVPLTRVSVFPLLLNPVTALPAPEVVTELT